MNLQIYPLAHHYHHHLLSPYGWTHTTKGLMAELTIALMAITVRENKNCEDHRLRNASKHDLGQSQKASFFT